MKKYLIPILLMTTLCYSKSIIDINHTSYYQELSMNEHINNTLIINDIIEWFKIQSTSIETITEKENNNIVVKYFFIKDITKSTLSLYYNNNICNQIILNMVVNGSPKIYYNEEAKRIMLMLLSYNEEFEYHQQD